MRVHVVIGDYGLNGASCLGVFTRPPTDQWLNDLELEQRRYTGWGGAEVEEFEVPTPNIDESDIIRLITIGAEYENQWLAQTKEGWAIIDRRTNARIDLVLPGAVAQQLMRARKL